MSGSRLATYCSIAVGLLAVLPATAGAVLSGTENGRIVSGGAGRDQLNGGADRDSCAGRSGRDRGAACERRSSL